jgi:hypothetical protein
MYVYTSNVVNTLRFMSIVALHLWYTSWFQPNLAAVNIWLIQNKGTVVFRIYVIGRSETDRVDRRDVCRRRILT